MAEFLPIIMFKQRSDDNQRVEGGGGDKIPGWYLQGDDLLFRSGELATGFLDGLAVTRKNPELPYLFEVQLDGDDTSKTKRSAVAGMLGDNAANEKPSIIGMRGTDSLIVQAKDEAAVQSMVDGVKDTERNVAGISCVKKVSAFRAEVDLSEAEDYKVKLVDYRNHDDNAACQRAFEKLLASEFITFFRCEYSSDLVIYDVEASPEQAQAMLDGIMGESIFSIKPMPRYEMTLDGLSLPNEIPDIKTPESEEYPTLGILDSGVERIDHLQPWLMEEQWSTYPDNEQDRSHGTFVAGVALYGDEFEHEAWIDGLPAMLFDAAVFPNPKVVGGVKESEIISNIQEALEYAHDRALAWNLSISGVGPVKPNEFSDFAVALDALQDKYGILICKTAGNSLAFLRGMDKEPLAKGADSVRCLTVGSVAHEAGTYDQASVGEASPFSCIGPGPEFIIKPEVSHYGGNAGVNPNTSEPTVSNVHSFGIDGKGAESAGTSFSTPRVSALASNLDFALDDESDALLVKALIMHSATFTDGKLIAPDDKVKELGFGVPASLPQILSDNPYEATLVMRGTLAKGEKINIMDFPMPHSLIRDGEYTGQIVLTLAYNPILDASQGGEYCQSDIKVMFGSFEEKVLRDINRPTILNEIGRTDTLNLLLDTPYSRKRLKEAEGDFALMERMLVEFAGKYAPVKKYAVDLADLKDSFKKKVGENRLWYLQLEPLFRYNIEQMALRTGEVLEQEFCVIITIRDPQKQAPVYNEVRQLLNYHNFEHSPIKLRNQVRAHIGG